MGLFLLIIFILNSLFFSFGEWFFRLVNVAAEEVLLLMHGCNMGSEEGVYGMLYARFVGLFAER